MKVSIIMPVYNEIDRVAEAVTRALAAPFPPQKEIIVVNDGSTDGTTDRLKALTLTGMIVLHQPRNCGKGAAIRAGLARATGDIVLIQDADLEYSPDDYFLLLRPILEGQADVVYGTRFLGAATHRVLLFWHYVGNRFLTMVSNMTTNLNLSDIEVGFKAFRREVIARLDLREDRFGFEPEVTAKIARLDCRVYEVPVSYFGRTYKEGKKITWRDGLVALWCILRYGLFP